MSNDTLHAALSEVSGENLRLRVGHMRLSGQTETLRRFIDDLVVDLARTADHMVLQGRESVLEAAKATAIATASKVQPAIDAATLAEKAAQAVLDAALDLYGYVAWARKAAPGDDAAGTGDEDMHSRLVAMETELANLRKGYVIVNERYNKAADAFKDITVHSKNAATASMDAAQRSSKTVRQAVEAAKAAAHQGALDAAELAAGAAERVAASAALAAAAAAAASSAAAIAARELPNTETLAASAEAAGAAVTAANAAAEATKLSNTASEFARQANKP